MKVLIYGIDSWSGCGAARKELDEYGIQYKYLSFSDSIMNLRKFLKYRDEEPMFDEIKAAGRVGLPLFQLEDGTLTFSLEEVIENTEK